MRFDIFRYFTFFQLVQMERLFLHNIVLVLSVLRYDPLQNCVFSVVLLLQFICHRLDCFAVPEHIRLRISVILRQPHR